MLNERYYWHVCFDDGDVWDCIGSHETRAEAEAELRRVRPRFPDAFLVRVTMTRMDRARTTSTLTVV
ncbi:MAG TPA: hypothetical protein VGQ08_13350 [Nitrospiraceae bacterium]|jgi:hypothetical protein|nr:hypothetical protein [Nitrospiraceae bacterium]